MTAAKRGGRRSMAASLGGDTPAQPTSRSAAQSSSGTPELAKVEIRRSLRTNGRLRLVEDRPGEHPNKWRPSDGSCRLSVAWSGEELVVDHFVLPNAIVDFRREEVRRPDGVRIDLRSRAFSVLRCLAAHAGKVASKDDLLAECWPGVIVTEDSLTQAISAIRQALGEGARDVVRTVPRRGYMLMPPAQVAGAGPNKSDLEPYLPYVWPGIAVLPFDDFGGQLGPLGASVAAEVAMELARNRDLPVLSCHASFAAAAQGLMPDDIARLFRIGYVLEGDVRLGPERIIINARLIDGRHSCHVWGEPFAASPGDAALFLQGQPARIAARVFSVIREVESFAALRRAADELSPAALIRRGFAAIKSLDRTRNCSPASRLLKRFA